MMMLIMPFSNELVPSALSRDRVKFSSETLELFVEIANDIYESLEDVKEESK